MTDLVEPLTGPCFPLTSSVVPGTPWEHPCGWRAPEQPITPTPQGAGVALGQQAGAWCSHQATGCLWVTLLTAPLSRKLPLSSATRSRSLNDPALGIVWYPSLQGKDTKLWREPRREDTSDQPQQWKRPLGAGGHPGHWPGTALLGPSEGPRPSPEQWVAGCHVTQSSGVWSSPRGDDTLQAPGLSRNRW